MESKVIAIKERVLSVNDKNANILRNIYAECHKYVINIMSSPGSGKTSLLEAMSEFSDFRFCVIEGDLQTNKDAERLQQKGILAHQISTGEACHLDSKMILDALPAIQGEAEFKSSDFLIIENVGNLVCPASYDLGANVNVVCLSVTEGDDKALKYPSMFLCADIVVITKCDLLPHFSFDLARVRADLATLRHNIMLLEISIKNKDSIVNLKNTFLSLKAQNYQSQHIFK